MSCALEYTDAKPDERGWREVWCPRCKRIFAPTPYPPEQLKFRCSGEPATVKGVGDHVHDILRRLRATPTAGCKCADMRRAMNDWGPAGCRQHRAEILEHLRTAYDEADVITKARAWISAKRLGLPTTLEGLLDLAIERAEAAA